MTLGRSKKKLTIVRIQVRNPTDLCKYKYIESREITVAEFAIVKAAKVA
ncbi:hypothetical protein [Scytonema sp. UIC 10036]|nr:hypothetical protein [Scytonema sp. UIC 10036]